MKERLLRDRWRPLTSLSGSLHAHIRASRRPRKGGISDGERRREGGGRDGEESRGGEIGLGFWVWVLRGYWEGIRGDEEGFAGTNIGMVDSAYVVGRNEILGWINDRLHLNHSPIEDVCVKTWFFLCFCMWGFKGRLIKKKDVTLALFWCCRWWVMKIVFFEKMCKSWSWCDLLVKIQLHWLSECSVFVWFLMLTMRGYSFLFSKKIFILYKW